MQLASANMYWLHISEGHKAMAAVTSIKAANFHKQQVTNAELLVWPAAACCATYCAASCVLPLTSTMSGRTATGIGSGGSSGAGPGPGAGDCTAPGPAAGAVLLLVLLLVFVLVLPAVISGPQAARHSS